MAFPVGEQRPWAISFSYPVVALASVGMLVGALSLRGRTRELIVNRLTVYLGQISYGLYVYHGILSQHMLRMNAEDRLGALLGGHSRGIVAQAVIGVGLSFLLALISYELFEKRFLALKRLFEAEKPASAAAPAVAPAGSAA